MVSTYGPIIDQVCDAHEGLPVCIQLRERRTLVPRHQVLYWSTQLPSGAHRRFYYDREHGTGIWKIPVKVAVSLFNRAAAHGILSEQHNALASNPTIVDSRCLSTHDRVHYWTTILTQGREPDWGADPLFVIATDLHYGEEQSWPAQTWRKLMIVDTYRKTCTFRGTTTDRTYAGKTSIGMGQPWFMDRFMPDSTAEIMREFRAVLLSLT